MAELTDSLDNRVLEDLQAVEVLVVITQQAEAAVEQVNLDKEDTAIRTMLIGICIQDMAQQHQAVPMVEMEHLLEEQDGNLVLLQIKIVVAETVDTVFTASAEAVEAVETMELVQALMEAAMAALVFPIHHMDRAVLQELMEQAAVAEVVQMEQHLELADLELA